MMRALITRVMLFHMASASAAPASAAPAIDLMVDPTLLSEIEQESFKMGAAKMQQLGRAHPQCIDHLDGLIIVKPIPMIRT